MLIFERERSFLQSHPCHVNHSFQHIHNVSTGHCNNVNKNAQNASECTLAEKTNRM